MRSNPVDIASLLLQIINLEMLLRDFNNADLMGKLEIIIEQNNKIIKLLEGREKDERVNRKS